MYFDVISFLSAKRCLRGCFIPKEETTGIHGYIQPFMRIQGDRIRQFESCKQMLLACVQSSRSTICTINVKPEIKLARNSSNFLKWIAVASVHSSRTRNNAERPQAVRPVCLDSFAQRPHTHSRSI